MKSKSKVVIFLMAAVVLFGGCATTPERYVPPGYVPWPEGKVIFEIGYENRSWRYLLGTGFKDKSEYICRIGVDCSAETFPEGMHVVQADPQYEDTEVKRIVFLFTLRRNYEHIVFRISRAGAETSVVSVDGAEPILVTWQMLDSYEGSKFGCYNLYLGEMNKGEHEIVLSVADDGKGNGALGLDAIALIAAKEKPGSGDN